MMFVFRLPFVAKEQHGNGKQRVLRLSLLVIYAVVGNKYVLEHEIQVEGEVQASFFVCLCVMMLRNLLSFAIVVNGRFGFEDVSS